MSEKKRKCLREITNTKNEKEIEYGYAIEDEDLIELDKISSNEETSNNNFSSDILTSDVEYGYVIEDSDLIELDKISDGEDEFYNDFYIPILH